MKSTYGVLLLSLLLSATCAAARAQAHDDCLGKPFGQALMVKPQGEVRGVALVLSDQVASSMPGGQLADALARSGVLVAVLPAQRYLAGLGDGHCSSAARDAEEVGRRLMRWAQMPTYFQPVLVGMGHSGSALARIAVTHARARTVASAVLVGTAEIPPAATCLTQTSTRQPFMMHMPVDSDQASIVEKVIAQLPDPRASLRKLTLIEWPAADSHRLVILLTGDGGWRWLDKGIGTQLHDRGISVVGWDSLRYFWTPRTPEQAAVALAAVINEYSRRWNADEVELVGYSFGADVLPFLYNRLPPATRAKVRSLSLLGLSPGAAFEVSLGEWMGASKDVAIAPELALIPPAKVLCVFGALEKDTLCPALVQRGVTVTEFPGGHHFDGDMPALIQRLQDHFQRNALDAQPPAPAPTVR